MMTLDYSSAFLRVFVTTLLLANSAHAEEDESSWRLQGPAFSHHFSTQGAPLRGAETRNDGENPPAISYSGYPAEPGESTANYCNRFTLKTVGAFSIYTDQIRSQCMDQLRHPYSIGGARRWDQNNAGIGLEHNFRNSESGTLQKYYFGAVVDSYFKPGIYVGTSYQKSIYAGDRFRLDAGATTMLWWRTVSDRDDNLHRRIVPVVLPVFSVEDKKSGAGANITFVPKIKVNGQFYSVNTLIFQLTWGL